VSTAVRYEDDDDEEEGTDFILRCAGIYIAPCDLGGVGRVTRTFCCGAGKT
jgi:hypothetical protein